MCLDLGASEKQGPNANVEPETGNWEPSLGSLMARILLFRFPPAKKNIGF